MKGNIIMNNYNKRNQIDLFDDDDPFFTPFVNFFSKESSKLLKTDIKETDKEYTLLMDVPGLTKKDIKISLDQKYLTVTATSDQESQEGTKYIRKERFYGTSTRSFYVGDIEQKDIKASFENGLLIIVIPKKNYQKAEEKKYIDIN